MMVEQVPAAAVAPELLAAMDAARAAIAHVVTLVDDGAGTDLGAQSLVGCLQAWEQIRNTMPVVDSVLIQHGAEQDIPRALTQRSMSQVLVDGLRLSAPEAHRRVTAAAHLAVRHSMLGQPLPPIRPRLAAAQRDGLVTVEQVAIVDDALRRVDRCDPDDVAGRRSWSRRPATFPPNSCGSSRSGWWRPSTLTVPSRTRRSSGGAATFG